ncbi:MAG: hypothetical protein P4L10_17410, partial [Acidobacteriaceae bacterium]|nr:hypothetical protein [Acidobacteriaceae bacterium]
MIRRWIQAFQSMVNPRLNAIHEYQHINFTTSLWQYDVGIFVRTILHSMLSLCSVSSPGVLGFWGFGVLGFW